MANVAQQAMIQTYYSAREIKVSETETAIELCSELGEAEAGSREADELCRNPSNGRIVVAADSETARGLEIGDLVTVDSEGMITGQVAS